MCCHGSILGYVAAYSFTYTIVSAPFLRNVPILIKIFTFMYNYSHKFVVFCSIDCTHDCSAIGMYLIPYHTSYYILHLIVLNDLKLCTPTPSTCLLFLALKVKLVLVILYKTNFSISCKHMLCSNGSFNYYLTMRSFPTSQKYS